MTLAAGTRLGPYEIVAPLGAGGMGEVYKAADIRLGRAVALKVLPDHLSARPEIRQRFEREARAISQLSHPHICALYDVGNHDGVEYLVMELLEGHTLAERLERGPLPPSQVLQYGIEISDALDRAHRGGIVHRDLKPGNVMLTRSGVKLLDFGLAKLEAAAVERDLDALSALPTEGPAAPLTEQGTVMGTFQYMSPEQLEGKDADARSDIFALGAVLYEMATGRRAFTGRSRASMIAAILEHDPAPISAVQPMTPPALDRVVQTCLAKEPDDRWQSAHDVMSQLKWIAEAGSQAGAPAAVASRRKNRERIAWIACAGAALAAAVFAVGWWRRAPRALPAISAQIPLPSGMFVGELALSPDASRIAFTASRPGATPSLWVRTLSTGAANRIEGAEEAFFPFWSPDGRSIGYFTSDSLKRIDPPGGPPITLCPASRGGGGTWASDGTIVFAPTPSSPLFRMSASGGTPAPVTKLDSAKRVTAHRYPSFLPDGKHFLYMAADLSGAIDEPAQSIRVGSVDGRTDALVLPMPANAIFAGGRLLYPKRGVVFAQRFDLSRWTPFGEPVAVAQHVSVSSWWNHWLFAATDDVLVTSDVFAPVSRLVWLDRSGKPLGTIGEARAYIDPTLSPDGRRLAICIFEPASLRNELWLYDTATGAPTKFAHGAWNVFAPAWAPTGDRIAFGSDRATKEGGRVDIWTKRLDGSPEEIFEESPDVRFPGSWSPDAKFLAFTAIAGRGKRTTEVDVIDLASKKVTVVSNRGAGDANGAFSPDGRWIAYDSDETGRSEVYVQPFPPTGRRWQVSSAGGSQPRWRRDGRELFLLTADDFIAAAPVTKDPELHVGTPVPLFRTHPNALTGISAFTYDVAADGQRFLVNTVAEDAPTPPLDVLVHWTALLDRH